MSTQDGPESVDAVLSYTSPLTPAGAEHGEYVGFASSTTESLPRLVDLRTPRRVRITSARGQPFRLRTHGFELRTQSTAVDFDDCAQVLRDYVPEVEELVRRTVVDNGAGEGLWAVLVWDLCLRDSTLTNELQEPSHAAEAGAALDRLAPVPLVHADCFDGAAVRARLRQRWERRTDTLSSFLGVDFAAKGRVTGAAEVAVVG